MYGILVVDPLPLILWDHWWSQEPADNHRAATTLTRTKASIVLAVVKTFFAGDNSAASLFKVPILSSTDDFAFLVRAAIATAGWCES